ncbi:MAG: hypothetical protein ACKOUQ_06955, partial [Aquirufa sp.]
MEPKKNWKYVPAPPAAEVEALGEALGLKNPYFLSLLVSRGIKTFQEVKDFMVPEISQLHDPFQILGQVQGAPPLCPYPSSGK